MWPQNITHHKTLLHFNQKRTTSISSKMLRVLTVNVPQWCTQSIQSNSTLSLCRTPSI